MTKASIQQFSATAASNTDINGVNVNVGWPPENVGTAFRTLMAFLANSLQPLALSVSGETAVTLTAAQAASFFISLTGALTGACTVTLPTAPFLGFILNATTGGETVTLTTGVGSTVTLPSSDGVCLFQIDSSGNVKIVAVLGSALSENGVTTSTTNTVTNKIAVLVGGTTYYLLASTSGT